jgi:hypothetical protein
MEARAGLLLAMEIRHVEIRQYRFRLGDIRDGAGADAAAGNGIEGPTRRSSYL